MPSRQPTLQHRQGDLLRARERFRLGEPVTPGAVRPFVLASWRRSIDYGVDPCTPARQEIDPARLEEARSASRELIEAATPFLDVMAESLRGEPHRIALSDGRGLILRLIDGPDPLADELAAGNLVEGASWHERDIGSNGIGTCLATGEPVTLVGAEHFHEAYLDWTCTGAPIRGAKGEIVGALDLAVPTAERDAHARGWTISVARAIERALARTGPGGAASGRAGAEPAVAGLDPSLRSILYSDLELLDRLIDEIPVMVVIYDPAIQEVRLNRHAQRVVGWTNEDVEKYGMLELCYPDAEYRARVRRFMESIKPGWHDADLAAKDGSVVRSSWANIRLTDNRLVGIGIDITDRVVQEETLRAAKEAAEHAERVKSQFLSTMSHELRTPLTAVIGLADLLEAGVPGPTTEAQKAHLGRIRRSAWQLVRIIDEILSFSRSEAGKESVRIEDVRVTEVARDVVGMLEPVAHDAGVELRLDDPGETLATRTDPGKVTQVITNLVGNAIKFSRSRVAVRPTADDEWLRVAVLDDGPGIPPDRIDDIFAPFTQLDSSNTREKGGTGLGLTVARRHARLLGGEIDVESTPGQGSTFTFRIPRRTP